MIPQKHLRIFLASLAVIFVLSAKSQTTTITTSLKGTWELSQYKPYDENTMDWHHYGDSIVYQKHLTDDHFVWFKYDKKNNHLLGMGGGSYTIDNGKYIENIKFFYPPGSSELGQSIPFDLDFMNNQWYHKGYSKVMDIDEATGKMVVADSNKIEEKWVRTKAESNSPNPVLGTWDLIAYREVEDGNYIEYPEYAGYMKLITPTHFTWIYFNKKDDEIYAAGSGKYEFTNNHYLETIEMIYPENTGQLGETVDFQTFIEENKWKHLGMLPQLILEKGTNTKVKGFTLIDEIWKAHHE